MVRELYRKCKPVNSTYQMRLFSRSNYDSIFVRITIILSVTVVLIVVVYGIYQLV